ncbi:MAG: aminoacyl-tRNA hydrolase [Chloroflexi bacterium]|nr:aminoacyl-tRNA hydrolase [Chloroflexota bacterium]
MASIVIVGLGNPGQLYSRNRHNVGFQCLNYFARLHTIPFKQKGTRSRLGIGEVNGIQIVLAKPQTFMNQSGLAVAALAQRYRLLPQDLVVIHDDLDLPLGKIRIRKRGSSGGHRGVQSIVEHLGSQEFPRLRVGIGTPLARDEDWDAVQHVLSDFTDEEWRVIQEVWAKVAEALVCLLSQGIEAAMNKYN